MRKIEYASTFEKSLKKLSKKHPDLQETINKELDKFASARKPIGDKIPNIGGHSVFKVRIPLGNQGKRSGARIIYYCDDDRILALFLYAKSDQSDVPVQEVLTALAEYHSESDSEPDT